MDGELEMLNEIIPGLSKSSETWQCCHRGAAPSREMFYLWIFYDVLVVYSAQLLAECSFGPSEDLEMLRKFSWSWLCAGRVAQLEILLIQGLKIVFVTGMVTLPLLARVPSGIHALGSAQSRA